MDFSLTEEQAMIRDMVQGFVDKELKPKAAYYDESKEFPFETLKALAGLGLMGMTIPQEYGGANVGTTAYSLAITEIAKGCAATAVTTSVTNMVAEVVHEFGTDEVKNKHLRGSAAVNIRQAPLPLPSPRLAPMPPISGPRRPRTAIHTSSTGRRPSSRAERIRASPWSGR